MSACSEKRGARRTAVARSNKNAYRTIRASETVWANFAAWGRYDGPAVC